MRKVAATAAVVIVVGAALGARQMSSDRLLDHIKFLSSDDLKGRRNGTPELERAAAYIRGQFQAAGLEPGWKSEWEQPFEMVAGLSISGDNQLTLRAGDRRVELRLGVSYFPIATVPSEVAGAPSATLNDVPLVFAGYGLSAPGQYDDYAGLDVKGKVVLIFSHEPQELDANSKLNGQRPMAQTTLMAKATAARSRGALALVVVSDPAHRTDEANYRMFGIEQYAENVGLPVLRVRRDEMRPLLDAWKLEALASDIDRDLMPRSRPLEGSSARYVEHLSVNRRTVRNIAGILRGADPRRAGEAIVIGAHYDHVGFGGRHSAAPELAGQIHNGADDNASGTAAIIEMARQAVETRSRFPRTLVFVAFAGEEDGLLGSEYYVRHAASSIEDTVAMLNLDMVGRSGGAVDVSGLETAPTLEADLKAAAQAVPSIRIQREGPGAGRSDDSSFIAKRVPAINFFTGFHDDYHRPSDDWNKIDGEGTRRVAALALKFAARIANRDLRPPFVWPQQN